MGGYICLFLENVYNKYSTTDVILEIRKQSPGVFYKKSFSWKFRKIHGKTPVSESLFNKVAGLQVSRPATLLKRYSNVGA